MSSQTRIYDEVLNKNYKLIVNNNTIMLIVPLISKLHRPTCLEGNGQNLKMPFSSKWVNEIFIKLLNTFKLYITHIIESRKKGLVEGKESEGLMHNQVISLCWVSTSTSFRYAQNSLTPTNHQLSRSAINLNTLFSWNYNPLTRYMLSNITKNI